jgi:hypothetical protein
MTFEEFLNDLTEEEAIKAQELLSQNPNLTVLALSILLNNNRKSVP